MTFPGDPYRNDKFPALYSITPPRADITDDRLERNISRLVERASRLSLNGLVVYDVQDERERTQEPRPFEFRPTLDSLVYSRKLRQALTIPVITYKCITGMDETEWLRRLREMVNAGIDAVSVVGLASAKSEQDGVTLSHALGLAAKHAPQIALGGVVIPERHTGDRNECTRLLKKANLGCSYFVSQAIYDPELTIRLLCDYAQSCQEINAVPQRIFLTFAPCDSDKTLEFMRWLGIHIPAETARRISTAAIPVAESVKICLSNFRLIQDALSDFAIPLGINVESVSARKDEGIAAIDLHQALCCMAAGKASV